MKKASNTVLLATLLSSSALAAPAGTNYAGGQFAQVTYDESGFDEFKPTALIGRFGHFFSPNFALEGRLGTGLSDDSKTYYESGYVVDLSFEVDSIIGVYGVGHLPVNDVFSVYGLAGYSRVDATVEATATDGFSTASISESGDESGFSLGVGAEVNVGPNAALTLEYVSYLDESDFTVDALSAGLNFRF
ncbi:porin family protein [Thiohalomonas denitrificans]|uniref:porin family protein n=1 Tax=Thiohalomonas denitrificans TaxID=415747 RepID=UPI0026EB5A4B|nr:porin family protein [Thiohalomonas denitrificans]